MIASFSRALAEGLKRSMSDAEFDKELADSIDEIYRAKTMGGDDRLVLVGLAAAIACGFAVGLANYLLIWALRIPPIIATLSASFIIQSIDISYGRGLQIKPPPGFADFTNIVIAGVPFSRS